MFDAQPDFSIADLVDEPSGGSSTISNFEADSSLPVKHFQMGTLPFLDNVNPDFFFRTQAHEDAYLKMRSCIEDNISIGLCTAISGTGKTLLTQILLNELESDHYKPVLALVYPGMSPTALLTEVATELEVEELPSTPRRAPLMAAIQEEIMRLHQQGVKPILIIDEVHFLKADALHTIRTLSNIELPDRKLITILLFGEENFLTRMHRPGYRALFSRMFVRSKLRPLYKEEVEQYIKFRLLMAGARSNIFEPDTFDLIFEKTNGVPREINRLCHNSLIWAAKNRGHIITREIIERVKEQD